MYPDCLCRRCLQHFATLCFLLLCLVACHLPSEHTATDNDSSMVTRLAVTSATHIGFLAELGQLDKVVAVTNKSLIYTPLPDSVIDLGDALSPNLELLLQADVDLVLVCSYAGSQLEAQLDRLGIRYLAIGEWKEATPLQRTEWIRTFGDLLGCRDKADSIYAAVEKRYHELSDSAEHPATTIMTGMNFRGTWYVPSGNTFMGHIFRDAGASYPFYDDQRPMSIPLTTEDCLITFRDADVWVGSEAQSLHDLADIDDKHTWFCAYQNKRVYNWLKQSTPTGGNNFWERGAVHPDEILEDLIHILSYSSDSLHFAVQLE